VVVYESTAGAPWARRRSWTGSSGSPHASGSEAVRAADETVIFERGRVHIVTVGPMTVGHELAEPGWRWATSLPGTTRGSWATSRWPRSTCRAWSGGLGHRRRGGVGEAVSARL